MEINLAGTASTVIGETYSRIVDRNAPIGMLLWGEYTVRHIRPMETIYHSAINQLKSAEQNFLRLLNSRNIAKILAGIRPLMDSGLTDTDTKCDTVDPPVKKQQFRREDSTENKTESERVVSPPQAAASDIDIDCTELLFLIDSYELSWEETHNTAQCLLSADDSLPPEKASDLRKALRSVFSQGGAYKPPQELTPELARVFCRAFFHQLICTDTKNKTSLKKKLATSYNIMCAQALHIAASASDTKLLSALLDIGVSVQTPYKGRTALHCAAVKGQANMITLLIRAGLEVNVKNQEGQTALHLAAEYNQPEVVKALVNCKGVQMDIHDNEGYTPLHCATYYDCVKTAEILIQAKANVHAKTTDKNMLTPKQIAYVKGSKECIRLFRNLNISE